MTGDILRIEDLGVQFTVPGGAVDAVKGVSLRVRPGSTVALVGESGSGKSVMSQAIMGILPKPARITSGRILFADPAKDGEITDIAALDQSGPQMRAIRGGRISIVFQEPMTSLSPLHTVGDQIGEAAKLHLNVGNEEALSLVKDMLGLVRFPDPAAAIDRYPFELSGGLRQRAMIAMALICRPAMLIADEPTTALDVTIQAQILRLMSDLQSELGMAILMITHDLGVVANMAEEVVVMYRGRVMESGTLDDIFGNPQHDYLKALMRAVPRFNMGPDERLIPLREIKPATSHLLTKSDDGDAKGASGALLTVDGLRRTFIARKNKGIFGGGLFSAPKEVVTAVDDVSFMIDQGECLGLVGESGCGKTTLSKMLMRALEPDRGQMIFQDRTKGPIDVLSLEGNALKHFRRRIQFVFQDPFGSLNPRMTVYDIISEPLVIHQIGDDAYRREMVRELMSLVGLDVRFLNRYPHSFSGGQRQRLGIARALALRPDLLILDEPVSALDVSVQAQILNLLKDLQDALGLTYLFISHNLAVVDYIADRIMVMCRGRIVETARREVLFDNPIHPYTRRLLAAVPEPDPNRRLDLRAIGEGELSSPAAWPEPFTINEQSTPGMIDLGGGHYVRASQAPRELEAVS